LKVWFTPSECLADERSYAVSFETMAEFVAWLKKLIEDEKPHQSKKPFEEIAGITVFPIDKSRHNCVYAKYRKFLKSKGFYECDLIVTIILETDTCAAIDKCTPRKQRS